jgi:hypothetical protein
MPRKAIGVENTRSKASFCIYTKAAFGSLGIYACLTWYIYQVRHLSVNSKDLSRQTHSRHLIVILLGIYTKQYNNGSLAIFALAFKNELFNLNLFQTTIRGDLLPYCFRM